MVNLPTVNFIGGPTKQVITGNIQGAWDTYILVAVITAVGVPAEKVLLDIVMNVKRAVIHLECDGE